MIILVILTYILMNLYLLFCLWRWLKLLLKEKFNKTAKTALVGGYSLLVLPGPLAYFMKKDKRQALLQRFHNRWLGIWIYSLMFSVIIDGVLLVLKAAKKNPKSPRFLKNASIVTGAVYVISVLSAAIYGIRHVKEIKVNRHHIRINKKMPGVSKMKVVLAADLHLGYSIGLEQVEQMVKKINACHPDLVIIAGDIFDNSYDAISRPKEIEKALRGIKSEKGVFAVYGNHDIDEDLFCGFSVQNKSKVKRDRREDEFLANSNITVLEDAVTCIDDAFYLVGRLDASKSGDGINKRKSLKELFKNLDRSKPIFLIDHQPTEMDEAAKEGADVQFSGHTHGGQFLPLSLSSSFIWENPWGVKKKKRMYSIVTSGVGIYGPDLRVGTDSEIMEITIHLKNGGYRTK